MRPVCRSRVGMHKAAPDKPGAGGMNDFKEPAPKPHTGKAAPPLGDGLNLNVRKSVSIPDSVIRTA